MKVELTQRQHEFLIETLNAWAELCQHESAAFSRLDAALARERLDRARRAEELLEHLAQF